MRGGGVITSTENPEQTRQSVTLKWRKVSEWVIESETGEYRVAKYEIQGRWYYNAWRHFDMLGGFPSAEEAKAECEAVRRRG